MVFEEKFFVEIPSLGRKTSRIFPSSNRQPGTKWRRSAFFEKFYTASSSQATLTALWENFHWSRRSGKTFIVSLSIPWAASSPCKHFIASTYVWYFFTKTLHLRPSFESLKKNRLAIANMKATGGRKNICFNIQNLQFTVD